MIRVLVDANVLISYLLTDIPSTSVVRAVELVLSDACQLIVPPELTHEVEQVCLKKGYLLQHISQQRLDRLFSLLDTYGVVPPPLPTQLGSFSRDPKDDYLLAYALVERVDYLVTGDKDLLVLGQVGRLSIVTPARFLERTSKR